MSVSNTRVIPKRSGTPEQRIAYYRATGVCPDCDLEHGFPHPGSDGSYPVDKPFVPCCAPPQTECEYHRAIYDQVGQDFATHMDLIDTAVVNAVAERDEQWREAIGNARAYRLRKPGDVQTASSRAAIARQRGRGKAK